jgi:hypothetical protein
MAARSFSITVFNWTGTPWHRVNMGLSHGMWSNGGSLVPPEQLPKASFNEDGDAQPGVAFFESESDGAATGTEGFADFDGPKGPLHIEWDNPFIGSNHFSASASGVFALGWGDPGGNDAHIDLTIRKR